MPSALCVLATSNAAGSRYAAGICAVLLFLADAAAVRRPDPAHRAAAAKQRLRRVLLRPGGLRRTVLLDTHRAARHIRPAQSVCPAAHHPVARLSRPLSRRLLLVAGKSPFAARLAHRPLITRVVDAGRICPRAGDYRLRLGCAGLQPGGRPLPAGRLCPRGRGALAYPAVRLLRRVAGAGAAQPRLETAGIAARAVDWRYRRRLAAAPSAFHRTRR